MQHRDLQLLEFLTLAVRFFSLAQIARLRRQDTANARRHTRKLVEAGFVKEIRIRAHPTPRISEPLCMWKPGCPDPDPGRVCYAVKKRWRNVQPREMTAYVATARTLGIFGFPGRPVLKPFQHSHDLAVAETFLHFHGRWPLISRRLWRGEDTFAHARGHGEKVEDAVLVHRETEMPMLAIEIVTPAYRKGRLAAFIEDVSSRNLPYVCY